MSVYGISNSKVIEPPHLSISRGTNNKTVVDIYTRILCSYKEQ